MERWNITNIPLFQRIRLAVRFSVSPRTRRSENKMDDQREENEHHQIEQLSFVYHSFLPGTFLIKGKSRARNLWVRARSR